MGSINNVPWRVGHLCISSLSPGILQKFCFVFQEMKAMLFA